MKFLLRLAFLSFVLAKCLSIHAQGKLHVQAYASSLFSERAFSWFLDHNNSAANQLAVQVTDEHLNAYISGCVVQAVAWHYFDPSFKVEVSPSDFQEIMPGLYVMRGAGGLFNAVFNKAGDIFVEIKVLHGNYEQHTQTYVFKNADFSGGFHSPYEGFVLSAPFFLSLNQSDPQYRVRSSDGTYYLALVDTKDKKGKPVFYYIPVHQSTHQVPADWETYQSTLKALIVSGHYDAFNPQKVRSLLADIEKIESSIKLGYISAQGIDYLTTLLNKLVIGAATGSASVYHDVSSMLATESARYLLSKASTPTSAAELFFLNVLRTNLTEIKDNLNYLASFTALMQRNNMLLNVHDANELYDRWRAVLTTTAITIDLAKNGIFSKTASERVLESQVKNIVGKWIPEQLKVVEMAQYMETNHKALLSSMKKSEEVLNSFYQSFEHHWDEKGDARVVFDKLQGKSLMMPKRQLTPISDLSCTNVGNKHLVRWQAPIGTKGDIRYVLKYSFEPIKTNQDWMNAYYVPMPVRISTHFGKGEVSFHPIGSGSQSVYYAIKYLIEDKSSSPFTYSSSSCVSGAKEDTVSESARDVFSRRFFTRTDSIVPTKPMSISTGKTDHPIEKQLQMVYVEGGQYFMGTSTPHYPDASPSHEIHLDGFYISKTPVTQALWVSVMGNNPSHFHGCNDCPVENVSWYEVHEFIRRLNQQTGKQYRLPTEAEWEYAAYGGKVQQNAMTIIVYQIHNRAWYRSNSNQRTHPVCQKRPNELGLCDMLGNVFEWCSDWYAGDYYQNSPKRNPQGPVTGSNKVIRGGAWSTNEQDVNHYYRAALPPHLKTENTGFRICHDE